MITVVTEHWSGDKLYLTKFGFSQTDTEDAMLNYGDGTGINLLEIEAVLKGGCPEIAGGG